jgi:hypothetical protein
MNRRVVLAIFALAVLAAAVILYLKLRDDDASAGTPGSTGSSPAADDEPKAPATRPTLAPANRDTAVASSDGSAGEVTINGVRIRDHRTGDHPPVDLPPNVHAPKSHRVAPTLTADISTKIQAVMHECVTAMPADARGAKPRLDGTIQIAIKDQQARITQSAVQLRDVVGSSADTTKQCIEQKSLGLTAPATDEPDLESYSISITFALM